MRHYNRGMPAVLAIETSSNVGSVCLLRDGVAHREVVRDDSKLSAWVLPAVDRVLQSATLGLHEIDAIAFGSGPGSFTGVRTACATAQALAYARKTPLFAVESCAALANAAVSTFDQKPQFNWAYDTIQVILDARMNELYHQSFSVSREKSSSASASQIAVAARSRIELLAVNAFDTAPLNAIGSGAVLLARAKGLARDHVERIEAVTQAAEMHWADAIAAQALSAWQLGDRGIDPRDAAPNYVRNHVAKTEAERALDARRAHTVAAA